MCGADDRGYCKDVSRSTMTDFGFKDNPSLLFAPTKSDVQGAPSVASRAMSQTGMVFLRGNRACGRPVDGALNGHVAPPPALAAEQIPSAGIAQLAV